MFMKKGFYTNFNSGTGGGANVNGAGGTGDNSGTNGAKPERRVIVRNAGAFASIGAFLRGAFVGLMYVAAVALSSVGLTALLNKPIRDMLIELAQKTLYGG